MGAVLLVLGFAVEAPAFPLVEPPQLVAGPIGPTLATLDYNGDGFVDIAGLGTDGTLVLRLGTATGFAPPQSLTLPGGGYASALVAGDLTGDGRDDLVAAFGQSASVVLIRGRADGGLAPVTAGDIHAMGTPTISNAIPTSIDIADLNGDGHPDVAAGMGVDGDSSTPANTLENGHVTIFLNDGTGGLTASPVTLPVNAPGDLLLLPLSGSGRPDLIVAQRNSPGATAVKIFRGGSGASFGPATYAPSGAQATGLDWGDFNEDGRPDLVVMHGAAGTLAAQPASVLPGSAGPAGVGAAITVPAADGGQIVVADLDRDG
ncbi:MAG: VCBS repeat-containing protein, partial [Planctomycetia bacterium]|nr:VCBS repeat-containing protein [Planctomycetia bacterium]